MPSTDYIQVYANGSWHNYILAGIQWDGYIYKVGNQCAGITGGWGIASQTLPTYSGSVSWGSAITISQPYYAAQNGVFSNVDIRTGGTIIALNKKFTYLRLNGTILNPIQQGNTTNITLTLRTIDRTSGAVLHSVSSEYYGKNTSIINISLPIPTSYAEHGNPFYVSVHVIHASGYVCSYKIDNIWFSN